MQLAVVNDTALGVLLLLGLAVLAVWTIVGVLVTAFYYEAQGSEHGHLARGVTIAFIFFWPVVLAWWLLIVTFDALVIFKKHFLDDVDPVDHDADAPKE